MNHEVRALEFPFMSLNDSEFLQLNINQDLNNPNYDLNHVLLSRVMNHDTCDDNDCIPLFDNSDYKQKSIYVTLDEINQLQSFTSTLSILHLNCRSLKKM